jgi:hypothetical protein
MSYYYHPENAFATDACGNPMLPELPLYQGSFYAFDASGGFNLSEGIEKVNLAEQSSLELFDLTNCVQVMMDVRLFNAKLGVMKDTSANTFILNDPSSNPYTYPYSTLKTTYNNVSQTFLDASGNQHDSISINAVEFALDISNGGNMSILSVGVLATLYDDFDNYIKEYFGYAGGFASLFDKAGSFEISEAFNEDKLHNLITSTISSDGSETTDGSGSWVADVSFGSSYSYTASNTKYNADISGGIQLQNIVKSLRFAVDSNVFSNRHPDGEQAPIQNPVATYAMSVADVSINSVIEDWQFYVSGVENRVIGVTLSTVESDPNNTNTYVYKLDLSHSSLLGRNFKLSENADGTGSTCAWNAASGITGIVNTGEGEGSPAPGTAGAFMKFKMTTAFTLQAEVTDPNFQSTPGIYYFADQKASVDGSTQVDTGNGVGVPGNGGFINTGTYNNSISASSDPSGNPDANNVHDVSYSYNFGVGDGFMANDIIFCRDGLSLEVKIVIDDEAYAPINNIGPFNTAALSTSQSSTFQSFTTDASANVILGGVPNATSSVEGTFLMSTDVTKTAITRQVRVPLVIRMANMSFGANAKYTDPMPPEGVAFQYAVTNVQG